jgi:integrase
VAAPPAPKGMSWDLVFGQPDGRPVGYNRDHADWKALLADADVRDARLHDARVTAASLLLLLKVPARVVMVEVLGHSSYARTMNTYSHVAPELNRDAAQLMAGALWDDATTEASTPSAGSHRETWLPTWLPIGPGQPARGPPRV